MLVVTIDCLLLSEVMVTGTNTVTEMVDFTVDEGLVVVVLC